MKGLLLKEPIDVNTLAGIADYDGAIQRAVLTGKENALTSQRTFSRFERWSASKRSNSDNKLFGKSL